MECCACVCAFARAASRRTPTHPLTAAALPLLPLLHHNRCLQIEGAHPIGCTAVSWSPAAPKGSLVSSQGPGQPVRRLVSSGCDSCVKVRRQGAALASRGCVGGFDVWWAVGCACLGAGLPACLGACDSCVKVS